MHWLSSAEIGNRFNDGCPKVRRNCCPCSIQSVQVLDPMKWLAQSWREEAENPNRQLSIRSKTRQLPEIGVGQLDKLEEEEKTPEDAANDEGDVSEEEDFDESDDGMLEHVINDDLLNDDDRRIFRKSIARIQRTPRRQLAYA